MDLGLKVTTVATVEKLIDKMQNDRLPWVKHAAQDTTIYLRSSYSGARRVITSALVGTVAYLPHVGDELEEYDVFAGILMLGMNNEEHLRLKARVLEVFLSEGDLVEYGTKLAIVEVFCEDRATLAEIDKEQGAIFFQEFA